MKLDCLCAASRNGVVHSSYVRVEVVGATGARRGTYQFPLPRDCRDVAVLLTLSDVSMYLHVRIYYVSCYPCLGSGKQRQVDRRRRCAFAMNHVRRRFVATGKLRLSVRYGTKRRTHPVELFAPEGVACWCAPQSFPTAVWLSSSCLGWGIDEPLMSGQVFGLPHPWRRQRIFQRIYTGADSSAFGFALCATACSRWR